MAPPRYDLMKMYQASNPAVFGSGSVTMRLPTDFALPGPNVGLTPELIAAGKKAKATTTVVEIPAYTYSNPFTGSIPDPTIAARALASKTGGGWQLGKGWVAGTTVAPNGQAALPAPSRNQTASDYWKNFHPGSTPEVMLPTGIGLIALKMRNQNLMV